jgi:hypothetical protein
MPVCHLHCLQDSPSRFTTKSSSVFMRSVVDALKLFWSDINSLEELRQIRAARHDVICDIATVREEKEELLRRKKGGGGKGRRIIMRDFEKAYAVVMANYFRIYPSPLYSDLHFNRRFRVSKRIFETVYLALQRDECFQLKCNCAGRWGIHPLVKTTAVFRHLGYGTSADQLDEQFAIAESTFLEARLKFCEVLVLLYFCVSVFVVCC